MRKMDSIEASGQWNIIYIIKKTLEVIRHRFKFSEFVDLIVDNVQNIVPSNYVEKVHEILNKLIDELIFL